MIVLPRKGPKSQGKFTAELFAKQGEQITGKFTAELLTKQMEHIPGKFTTEFFFLKKFSNEFFAKQGEQTAGTVTVECLAKQGNKYTKILPLIFCEARETCNSLLIFLLNKKEQISGKFTC